MKRIALSPRSTLAGAAMIVAAGFLGSRLLGLVRSVVIANAFGTSPEISAYWVAFRVPDLIFQVLAGATLGAAFIPIFARESTERGDDEAWNLASSVFNLIALATVVLAALGAIFAPLLVPAIAPGLEERSLAVNLTRLMMLSPILFAASGIITGILNGRHHFLFPAVAPWFYNLSIIGAALVTNSVHGLAVGVVVGALLHLLVQIPGLRLVGMSYRFVADWRSESVRRVARLMAPRMLGLAAFQLNFVIMVFFASRVSDAAISAANYAWLIVMTPLGIVGMAISTAVFPTLAEQAVTDIAALKETLSRALRLILFLSIPAGFGLIVLGKPLVSFLFQHGAFDASSTEITHSALLFFAIGLFAHSGIEILSRGYYALGDTRTPVVFAVVSLVANLVLCLILVGPFGIRGLALALSIAAILELALSFRWLNMRLDGIEVGALIPSVARTVGASVLMAEVVSLYLVVLSVAGHLTTSTVDSFLALVGGAILGGATFFITSNILRSEEAADLLRRVPVLRPPEPAEPAFIE